MRQTFTFTAKQVAKLQQVQNVLTELHQFKPLTLRQIYYQLVGKGFIENNVSQYGMLSKLLKHARIEGYISWADVEDRVRAYHNLTGWESSDSFINASLNYFLKNYRRDLMQGQSKYIEVWIEKDALSTVFTRIATQYTVPVVVCRGFSSISFLNDYRQRVEQYDRPATILYFGDFDPSGCEMVTAMAETLTNELHVQNFDIKRVALSKADIFQYNLPHSPDALKKSDTRAAKHVRRYGELAVELDALPPDVLQDKVRAAIEAEIDMAIFNRQVETERKEFDKLNFLKGKTIDFLQQHLKAQ